MYGYCNRCENHCAMNDLHCERGYRSEAFEMNAGRKSDGAGRFRTLPAPAGGEPMRGGFREGMGGRARALPFGDEPHEFGGHHGFDERRDFDGPGGPGGFGGPGRPGGRGGHGMPPHGGMPPFRGRPPRPAPDAGMLRERIDGAGLAELIELSGRLMHHRPGAGSARGQNLVLSILAGRDTLSQRELQQMLGVQPGSMSEIVSKLEKKGLATREKGEDRRGNLLRITEAGRRAIPQSPSEPEDELFAALDEAQRDALAGLLRTLLNDWVSKLEREPQGRGGRFETLPERPEPDGRFITLEERRPDGGKGVKL